MRSLPVGPRLDVRFEVWFDGALHGGVGTGGGAGAVVIVAGQLAWQGARYLEPAPGASSMTAEYGGLLLGLGAAARLAGARRQGAVAPVVVYGDCKVIVRQMCGEVVARKTAPLQREASRRTEALAEATRAPVEFRHVPRDRNGWADSLARGAIDAFAAAHSGRSLALARAGRRRDSLCALRVARRRGAPCGDAPLEELLSLCEAAEDWPMYLDAYREAQACGSAVARLAPRADAALAAFRAEGVTRGAELQTIRRSMRSAAKRAAALSGARPSSPARLGTCPAPGGAAERLASRGVAQMDPWRRVVYSEAGGQAALRGEMEGADAALERLADVLAAPGGLGFSPAGPFSMCDGA
jgi:ribonuclease HI